MNWVLLLHFQSWKHEHLHFTIINERWVIGTFFSFIFNTLLHVIFGAFYPKVRQFIAPTFISMIRKVFQLNESFIPASLLSEHQKSPNCVTSPKVSGMPLKRTPENLWPSDVRWNLGTTFYCTSLSQISESQDSLSWEEVPKRQTHDRRIVRKLTRFQLILFSFLQNFNKRNQNETGNPPQIMMTGLFGNFWLNPLGEIRQEKNMRSCFAQRTPDQVKKSCSPKT